MTTLSTFWVALDTVPLHESMVGSGACNQTGFFAVVFAFFLSVFLAVVFAFFVVAGGAWRAFFVAYFTASRLGSIGEGGRSGIVSILCVLQVHPRK